MDSCIQDASASYRSQRHVPLGSWDVSLSTYEYQKFSKANEGKSVWEDHQSKLFGKRVFNESSIALLFWGKEREHAWLFLEVQWNSSFSTASSKCSPVLFLGHPSRGTWFYSCSRPSLLTGVCKVVLISVGQGKWVVQVCYLTALGQRFWRIICSTDTIYSNF